VSGAVTPAVPRRKRFDDPVNVGDALTLWRGIDPLQSWNASNFNPQALSNRIASAVFSTEELSTKAADRITLADLRLRLPGWKFAEFTVGEARGIGYIALRDPQEPLDVVLYSAADPDNPPPNGLPKRLSKLARLV
jgi:hypothetical protein